MTVRYIGLDFEASGTNPWGEHVPQAGLQNRMWNVIVGWNVAGYDRQFITRWMPNLNRLLSYRTVDLNALVFAQAGDSEQKYQDWHDAEYDAVAALHSLAYLTSLVGGDG